MCTPPLFAPPQRMAEPIPSLLPFFPPPEISSFWGTLIAITPSGTQELLPTPAGKKYSTGSSPLTSSPSMTLTHPPFYIAPLLTFPLPPLVLPFLAHGRCYRTWVLNLPILLSIPLSPVFRPNERPLPSIFRKLAGMGLPPTLTLTAFSRGILVSSSFLYCCSLYLSGTECGQIFHSFRPHQTPS